jgi:glycosyltransferase involved in cell wall biosynthesis
MIVSCRPAQRIGISLGNIAALNDGLGEYSLQLGRRIAAQAPNWRESDGITIDFHLRDTLIGLFGDDVGYLPVTRWQRQRHLQPQRYALWHSLHQLNKTLPPQGCGPRVVTFHDLNYLYHPSAFARWRNEKRTGALAARTDHIVAISQHTADDVRSHLGWTGPLDVIHNGARNLGGDPQAPLPGREAGRRFLFHLSRMSPSKNTAAIVALAASWPEMDFVLCGPEGDDSRAMRAMPHTANVHFHLGISDAQKTWAYANCAGFLFPSLAEGFGLPPIEAMHFGKPVFLSRRTCLPEIGGDAAFYFDDFEPAAMRRTVEHGLRRAAEPGREVFVKAHAAQFDWDRCAERYLGLYRRLLGLAAR